MRTIAQRRHATTWTAIAAAVLATLAVASAAAAPAKGTPPGTVVDRASASGQFAVASAQGTVRRPRALYVRLVGGVESGTIIVGCARGSSASANTYTRTRPGTFGIPIRPRRADVCEVTAGVGGSGRVVVEIRAVR
jgi:hypothetical protein